MRVLYLVGPGPPLNALACLWPPRKGKCELSNLSSIQSSMMSLITGVQRLIYVEEENTKQVRLVKESSFLV